MKTAQENLERAVIDKLLFGESSVVNDLRQQVLLLEVRDRIFSETGFFTTFAPRHQNLATSIGDVDFAFGDVSADINGLAHGAGFVLFVRRGVIDTLEGCSYEE